MSWVAAGTTAVGAVGSILGGGGDAPAGPNVSGNGDTTFNFGNRPAKSQNVLIVAALAVVGVLAALFVWVNRRNK